MKAPKELTTTIGLVLTVVISATTACAAAGPKETDQTTDFRELREKLSSLSAEAGTSEIVSVTESFGELEAQQPSQFWEEIEACGFYPQESRLECVLTIKQRGGYGGPVGAFGSFENTLFCVDWNGNGLFDTSPLWGSIESVGSGNVHMHDQPQNPDPPWHYSVYRDIDLPGGPRTTLDFATTTTQTAAPTLKARAILSWLYAPRDCEYVPIWGTIFDFRIRVDPIR